MAPTTRRMADSYWLRQPYGFILAATQGLLFNWHGWRPILVCGVHSQGLLYHAHGWKPIHACAHLVGERVVWGEFLFRAVYVYQITRHRAVNHGSLGGHRQLTNSYSPVTIS